MKKFIFYIFSLTILCYSHAQETIYPAPPQQESLAYVNATIHVGNGQVIENGTVIFEKGKITYAGPSTQVNTGVKQVDATGKHIYPGVILSKTNLGLVEVGAGTRATNDVAELGLINPNIKAIVAYNTDSKIINTLRSNGILLAGVTPQGGLISGSSSVVQLDAWNWEDATYKSNGGIHFNMPSLLNRPNPFSAFFGQQQQQGDRIRTALDRIETVKQFFLQAKAYNQESKHTSANLKYESVKGLFNKSQKLYVHCDLVKEMLIAIDFVKEFGFDVVIVGGVDSWQIPELLKQNNIAVILAPPHNLPAMDDDDVDQPFKTAAMLQKAGVLFAINDDDGQTRGRNLIFNAGTAASYGLTKEEALSAITLNAAKILGIADRTGSIETGKDANIVITSGDLLDMRSSNVTDAFIQGRKIDLNDKHKQLYERYKHKYELK
jgi:imidazolonepropionase-like amidohydrolase